jgi:hypothetical protein
MGAWGLQSFENDDAADWVYAFEEQGTKLVAETFDALEIDGDDYLDAALCAEALAAAEIVAAAKTADDARLSEEAAAALKNNSTGVATPENITKALEAVQRIKEDSELRDLWEESDDFADWLKDLGTLQKLLS